MAIILNIDTAVNTASVCLAKEAHSLRFALNNNQKDHAAWLHLAMQTVIADAGLNIKDLEAIAVSIGPGSYTGLRIGLSTAKGLCFALGIPLITINTLEMMAYAVKNEAADFFCPVIDARRMEVFMAIFDQNMKVLISPCAMIAEQKRFDPLLAKGKMIFSGNGSEKMRGIISHSNAIFKNTAATAIDMIALTADKFSQKRFSDNAYTEPFYVKEFYTTAR